MAEAPVRLKPAHDIYPAADGTWRIASPGDRFDRIELPFEVAAGVARSLVGEGEDERELGGERQAFLAAFVAAGYAEAQVRPASCGGAVSLIGDAPYLSLVADLLRGAGVAAAEAPAAGGVRVFGQLNLDDGEMDRWDAEAAEAGVARHRAFFEGGRWFVGPLTLPGQTATYADYRSRRLAACDVPGELVEYWRRLPGLRRRMPSPGVLALIAGFLVSDILAVLDGRRPPTAGFQVELDPDTLLTTWHPVLPLPGGLWEGQ